MWAFVIVWRPLSVGRRSYTFPFLLFWNYWTKFGWDGPWVVPLQNCVRQPRIPFKMAAVTKKRNFFNCYLLFYYKSKWAQILIAGCFSTKHAALRRKSKDWLGRNQDNVSQWGSMCLSMDCCLSELALWSRPRQLLSKFSEWLLLNTTSAMYRLYHGENKLYFNEMMMFTCTRPTYLVEFL
jgi:hypothetical protein